MMIAAFIKRVLIWITALLASFSCVFAFAVPRLDVPDGQVDLSAIDFKTHPRIEVSGEWHWHSQQWLTPSELRLMEPSKEMASFRGGLPTLWPQSIPSASDFSSPKFGTLQLQLLPSESLETLALRVTATNVNYRVWLNDEEIGSAGNLFDGAVSSGKAFRAAIIPLPDFSDPSVLTIQYAVYWRSTTNPIPLVHLGTEPALSAQLNRQLNWSLMSFGAAFMVMFYYLIVYFFHRNQWPYLFIAFFALSVAGFQLSDAFRFSTWQLLISGEWLHRIKMFSMASMLPAVWGIARSLYFDDIPKKPWRFVIGAYLLYCGLLIFTPATVFSRYLSYWSMFQLIMLAYLVYLAVTIVRLKRPSAALLALAAGYIVAVGLANLIYISNGNVEPIVPDFSIAILIIAILVNQYDFNLFERVTLLSENLQAQVNERTQQLAIAKEAAEKANDEKTTFLATASHDLRQPLHNIGFLIEELKFQPNTPPTPQLVNSLSNSHEYLSALLNSLLDISKIESGTMELEKKVIDISELLTDIVTGYENQATQKGLALKSRIEKGYAYSDPHLLQRILSNLVSNAIKYTESGTVEVSAVQLENDWSIRVSDTGPGIPESDTEKVFQAFYQLDNDARYQKRGLGLGLFIVKELAEQLEHNIRIDSNTDGTHVSISVPGIQVHEPLKTKVESGDLPSLNGMVICIVDNEPDLLSSTELMLKHWGATVISASTKQEALAQCVDEEVHILLTDLMLDNETGFDVVEGMRKQQGDSLITFAITGSSDPVLIEKAKAQKLPLFSKPANTKQLHAALNQAYRSLIADA